MWMAILMSNHFICPLLPKGMKKKRKEGQMFMRFRDACTIVFEFLQNSTDVLRKAGECYSLFVIDAAIILITCFSVLVQNIQINSCLTLLAIMVTIVFWRRSFFSCSLLTRFDILVIECTIL